MFLLAFEIVLVFMVQASYIKTIHKVVSAGRCSAEEQREGCLLTARSTPFEAVLKQAFR